MSTNKMSKDGINYQMGVSIHDVGRGDVIKVGSGNFGPLETIARIEGERMGTRIVTESGRSYTMLEVYSYGKKEENHK